MVITRCLSMAVPAAETQKGAPVLTVHITLCAPHLISAKSAIKCDPSVQVELHHEKVHFGERVSLK